MMNVTESKENTQSSILRATVGQLQFIPGIWVNGRYYWLQNSTEKVISDEDMIMKVKQEQLHSKIRLSTVYVSNYSNEKKEIKILAMHHYLKVLDEQLTFVSPTENKIFHLANNFVFLVNGKFKEDDMRECTVMPQWNVFTDQIWSSLKMGTLKYQPMVKGLASSVFTVKMTIKPRETNMMNTWIIGGTSKNEVHSLEQALLKNRLAFPPKK